MSRTHLIIVCSLALAACNPIVTGGGGNPDTSPGADGNPAAGPSGPGRSSVIVGSSGAGGGGAGGGGVGGSGGVSSASGGSTWTPPAGNACGRTGTDPGAADPYGHLLYGLAATWSGTATPPKGWVDSPSWNVWMSFHADGTYSAHSLDGAIVPALYYGSDDDVPGKTYTIDDPQSNGNGVGSIQVYFLPGDWNTGDLEEISLSDDLSTVDFQFSKSGYGPVLFHLTCTP